MISVLHKAFDILERLARHDRPLPLGELARQLDMHPATCANILRTLKDRGVVEQAVPRGGYTLGPTLQALGLHDSPNQRALQAALPVLEDLVAVTGETCMLSQVSGSRRIVLCQVEGPGEIQVRAQSAVSHDDVFRSASGRVIAAYMAPNRLRRLVEQVGGLAQDWPEAADNSLERELKRIRSAELSVVRRGQIVGLAVPVWRDAAVVAALGSFLPAYRYRQHHAALVRRALHEHAARIRQLLTAEPPPTSDQLR